MNKKELLLNTLNGDIRTQYKPIWFMRQAGRFLKGYRTIREKYDFLTMCTTPQLAAEATILPVKQLDVDAMILFSDILIPLMAMGAELHYKDGDSPIVGGIDLFNIKYDKSDMENIEFVLDTIKIIKDRIKDTALIGFAAAPFTLGCYLFGAGGDFYKIRSFIYRYPEKFLDIMGVLTKLTKDYLNSQIAAGVDSVQLFDSWAGIVPADVYERFIYPFNEEIAEALDVPSIYYIKNSSHINSKIVNLEFDCLSVDWRQSISSIHSKSKRCVQGNLDNTVLLSGRKAILSQAKKILKDTVDIPHIFNLGHGVLPQTNPDDVKFLIDLVHNAQI